MKIIPHVFSALICLLASVTVYSQTREAYPTPTHQFPVADGINDTLGWWAFTQGTQTLYESPNGGYVFGVNGFNDLEKARAFSKHDTSSVDEVLLLFGAKSLTSGDLNSHVRVVAYRPDTIGHGVIGWIPGAPGSEMGSVDLLLSDIDTSGGFTSVDFSSIVFDTTSFLISIDLTGIAAGDTVGLVSTTDGDAWGESVWERQSNGTWVTLLEPNIGWDLDCHPGIFAVLNAMEVGISESSPQLPMVWPNPSNGELNVANPTQKGMIINVISLDSRIVVSQILLPRGGAKLDVSGLSSGTYVLQSVSASETTSQMIIIH